MQEKKKSLSDIERAVRVSREMIDKSIDTGLENLVIKEVKEYFAINNKYVRELSLYKNITQEIMTINNRLVEKENELTRYLKMGLVCRCQKCGSNVIVEEIKILQEEIDSLKKKRATLKSDLEERKYD